MTERPCITCSDEAVQMRVLRLGDRAAVCEDARGDRHEVAIDLVGPVQVGQQLLVHAGVAIA